MLALRNDGYSLVEKLAVVAILGIAATVAVPNLDTFDSARLDLAANEVLEALRHARAESMRSGDPYGVTIVASTDRIIVLKAQMSPLPVVPKFTVYHPVRKQLWDLQLDARPQLAGVDIDNSLGPFLFVGLAAQPLVLFDPTGRPYGVDVTNGSTYRLADNVGVTLNFGAEDRRVELDRITGRATITD